MATWFEQHAVDLIGHTLTLIGIVMAAVGVAWQLGRQHKSSLKLQQENSREVLKLQLHELLVQKARKLSQASVKAAMYAYTIPLNVENFQRQAAQGLHPTPIKEREPEFSRLHAEAHDVLVEVMQEFEAWSIAFPGLEVFNLALIVAGHDAREAFAPLFILLLRALPIDPPEDAPLNVPRPLLQRPLSDDECAQLRKLVERYKEAMDDITCYVHDLIIESQNNLLSGLFGHRVPLRKPMDPRCKVITTEPKAAEKLRHYFENETSWGRTKRVTEQDVKARLGL